MSPGCHRVRGAQQQRQRAPQVLSPPSSRSQERQDVFNQSRIPLLSKALKKNARLESFCSCRGAGAELQHIPVCFCSFAASPILPCSRCCKSGTAPTYTLIYRRRERSRIDAQAGEIQDQRKRSLLGNERASPLPRFKVLEEFSLPVQRMQIHVPECSVSARAKSCPCPRRAPPWHPAAKGSAGSWPRQGAAARAGGGCAWGHARGQAYGGPRAPHPPPAPAKSPPLGSKLGGPGPARAGSCPLLALLPAGPGGCVGATGELGMGDMQGPPPQHRAGAACSRERAEGDTWSQTFCHL